MTVTLLDELKLDVWDGSDGDNSILSNGVSDPGPIELTKLQFLEKTHQVNRLISKTPGPRVAQAIIVPFRRQLKFGAVGNDVLAVKRALATAGVSPWGEWGNLPRTYGTNARSHVRTFQQRNSLHVDGVYGPTTHKKLAPFFDSYGAYLMKSYKPPVIKKASKRDNLVSAAVFGYQNRGSIHYTESSWRMYGVKNKIHPPGIPRYEDCSSFVTWCYYTAGLPDPNGFNYNGLGYTGTLTRHGKAIQSRDAQPGDLFFYGGNYWVPGHVAMYVGNGMVISHGSESGPILVNAFYRGVTEVRSYV